MISIILGSNRCFWPGGLCSYRGNTAAACEHGCLVSRSTAASKHLFSSTCQFTLIAPIQPDCTVCRPAIMRTLLIYQSIQILL